MKVNGIKIPYWVKIILVIILDIWLLWSHHGLVYNTARNKLELPSIYDNCNDTAGSQWPCTWLKDATKKHKVSVIPKNARINFCKHYNIVYTESVSFKDLILCTNVCPFGRFAVWPLIISTNFIYLTTNEFRKTSKTKNTLQIIGWVLIGLALANPLIWGNWPLFIRSIPAYIILILLQLDLYADDNQDDKTTKNIPSTKPQRTDPQPTI